MSIRSESSAVFGLNFYSSTAGNYSQIPLVKFNGTKSSYSAVTDGHILGGINFGGSYSSSASQSAAFIRVYATETWSSSVKGNEMIFSTTKTGGNSSEARIAISGDGYVGIGTYTPTELLDIKYETGVFLKSFQGDVDKDITGWIATNENGDTCYCYPNSAGNGVTVTTIKP